MDELFYETLGIFMWVVLHMIETFDVKAFTSRLSDLTTRNTTVFDFFQIVGTNNAKYCDS